MILGSNPIFDFGDDDYVYGYPNYSHRRMAATEEARRRKEAERYYRMKELEEQERRRRQHQQQHLARLRQQQQEEEEYRLAYEAAMKRRRREAEMAQRRQERLRDLAMQQRQQQRHDISEEDDTSTLSDDEAEPVYRIVQGPDGRLYRVNVGKTLTRPKKSTRKMSVDKENEVPHVKARPESKATTRQPLDENQKTHDESKKTIPIPLTTADKNEVSAVRRRNSKRGKNKKNKKKLTIIVEDALDSEYDDDYNSPWRNRRPSPGEWLEPVEGIENLRV